MHYAVIQTGGKQYLVREGKKYRFEKLPGNPGDAVTLDRVLLTFGEGGEHVRMGTPTVSGAQVVGKIIQQGRADKITVVKYKAKSRYRRKLGHRQHFTEVEIGGIR
ncbi:50S ribosomal protein L21 [Candidatus Uhrbacteria bacterium]|nr:50S ribosomal protein L21 [Candidatus Uhrbacteria bacterium]